MNPTNRPIAGLVASVIAVLFAGTIAIFMTVKSGLVHVAFDAHVPGLMEGGALAICAILAWFILFYEDQVKLGWRLLATGILLSVVVGQWIWHSTSVTIHGWFI